MTTTGPKLYPPTDEFDGEDLAPIRASLLRYRIMAWIVGILLVVLVCVGMPMKYLKGDPRIVEWVGAPHGWLYAILLICVYDLQRRVRWSWKWLLLIALCGTIPFLTFVAEHFAAKDVKRRLATAELMRLRPQ